jgi:hypothetical protein
VITDENRKEFEQRGPLGVRKQTRSLRVESGRTAPTQEDRDGEEDQAREKAGPGTGGGQAGLRGQIRGEEDREVEGQGEARS